MYAKKKKPTPEEKKKNVVNSIYGLQRYTNSNLSMSHLKAASGKMRFSSV